MNTEIIGIVAQVVLMVVLSYPLGKYIARVYQGRKGSDRIYEADRRMDFPSFGHPSR